MKKDPGVPNSAPFKEEVLREAEQRRLQVGFIHKHHHHLVCCTLALEGVLKNCQARHVYCAVCIYCMFLLLFIFAFLSLKKKMRENDKPKRRNEP